MMAEPIQLQFRNAKPNADGTIDCEINHPDFGWIPFTADTNDVEPHGREIWAALNETPDAALGHAQQPTV